MEIDGRLGEGGGQVLRSSLALSALTGKPFSMTHIRGNRGRPGLRPQHLAAVRLAAGLCQAEFAGAEIGSHELLFRPGPIQPGRHTVDVGTAGSVTLITQAVLLPALHAPGPVELVIRGGTDVPLSPPYDYLREVVLPHFERFGKVETHLEKRGFVPKGGGTLVVRVTPTRRGRPLRRLENVDWSGVSARVVIGAAPQGEALRKQFRTIFQNLQIRWEVELAESDSPGVALTLWASGPFSERIGITALAGRKVKPGEFTYSLYEDFQELLSRPAPVEGHLADQLIPILAVCGGEMRCQQYTLHCTTNMAICEMFTGTNFHRNGDELVAVLANS